MGLNDKINNFINKNKAKKDGKPVDMNLASNDNSSNKQATPSKNNKKNELLNTFDESVWESVHEDLKANTQFVFTNDKDEVRYVALLLDTNSIGGLAGKVAKKDESKGSIIEAIRTGRIKTYIRNDMLLDNCFVIIPDEETLLNMDEFRILVECDYILCEIDSEGHMMTLEKSNGDDLTITYQRIRSFVDSGDDVRTLYPGGSTQSDVFNGEEIEDELEEAGEEIEDLPGSNSDDSNIPEDLPDIDENGLDFDDPDDIAPVNQSLNDFDEINENIKPVSDIESNTDNNSNNISDNRNTKDSWTCTVCNTAGNTGKFCSNCGSPNPNIPYGEIQKTMAMTGQLNNQVVSPNVDALDFDDTADSDKYNEAEYYDDSVDPVVENDVDNFVIRKFYSDDLGLEVSTEAFDVQFMRGNPYVPFDEHRGSGWLNEQLSNISKDGNVRMERIHNENLYILRNSFMRSLQQACANISESLDISNNNTRTTFGAMNQAIREKYEERKNNIEKTIEPKIDKLEKEWNDSLEQIGKRAYHDAIENHKQIYGQDHNDDINHIRDYELDSIERDYNNAVKRLNEDRRANATKLLDLAINDALSALSNDYLKMLEDEKTEYIRIQNEITKFMDDNRVNEIARIEVLKEENKKNNKAEEVRKEYIAKVKTMAAEFEAKSTNLQAEINQMRINSENKLKTTVTDWENRLNEEKERSESTQKQLDELLIKYANLENDKNNEYAERLTRLKDENEAYREELDHVVAVHKRSNKIVMYLSIAAVIAFLGIGFMVGTIYNIHRTADADREAIEKAKNASTSSVVVSDKSENKDDKSKTSKTSEIENSEITEDHPEAGTDATEQNSVSTTTPMTEIPTNN